MPGISIRRGRGATYIGYPEIMYDPAAPRAAEIRRVAGELLIIFEGVIREHPDQWHVLSPVWEGPPAPRPSNTSARAGLHRRLEIPLISVSLPLTLIVAYLGARTLGIASDSGLRPGWWHASALAALLLMPATISLGCARQVASRIRDGFGARLRHAAAAILALGVFLNTTGLVLMAIQNA